MKLECKAYGCLCELEEFMINGIAAQYEDFGIKEDCCPKDAEPYGCGDMQFIPKYASEKVLNKYHITADEYDEVCRKLDKELSFGQCGWCV